MSDITISAGMRSGLLALQNSSDLINRTNRRLSTGLKVSSAIDDAPAYFQAKSLRSRAEDLSEKKDGIDQGISSLKSATTTLESLEKIMTQIKGIVLSAKSATNTERADLATQYQTLASQVNNLVTDASFAGLNLLNSTAAQLTINFSDKSAAQLEVQGVDMRFSKFAGLTDSVASASGVSLTAFDSTFSGWGTVSNSVSVFDSVIDTFDSAIATVRSNAKTLGTNVALLQTRLDFTKNYMNALTEGADKLTLADLNEEGSNLIALQTRQQLSFQALSFAGQQEQGIMTLFR